MLDLSVIIPIYNTPTEYLHRCFQSMLELDNIAYEVLLIDDGSQEYVGQFCKAYVSEHPNFQYIYKENGGVSSARNLGISQAKGRYLTFVDADDQIMGQVLAQHLPSDSEVDLVLFDILLTQNGSNSVWSALPCSEGSLEREQVLYQLCTASSISGPVAKLYNTRLLQSKKIEFNTQFISGEDWMFVCDYVLQSQSFLYHPQCVYNYFRTHATGHARLVRFPDKMLQNQISRYERKLQVIETETWQAYNPEQIRSLAAIEIIENLFNTAAELLLARQYSTARKELIREAVVSAGNLLLAPIPKKTQGKLLVLARFPSMLFLLAKVRALYLNMK